MAKLASVDFDTLDATGKNFLSWQLDIKLHLQSLGLNQTIAADVVVADKDKAQNAINKAKAIIYIRRHLDKTLKSEYLTVEDPYKLWEALDERYKHQKDVILPRARYEWENLRLQDFKSIAEYNSALFNITSRLELCGEGVSQTRMLEKTYTSFHEKDAILMQQYRERNFTKYSELLACLLMAEQNKELLLVTHNMRPSGASPLPENHKVISQQNNKKRKGNFQSWKGKKKQTDWKPHQYKKKYNDGKKQFPKKKAEQQTAPPPPPKRDWEDRCQRCGMEGHWSKVCRTPRHLQDLFQENMKKKAESNMVTAQLVVPTQYKAAVFETDDLD